MSATFAPVYIVTRQRAHGTEYVDTKGSWTRSRDKARVMNSEMARMVARAAGGRATKIQTTIVKGTRITKTQVVSAPRKKNPLGDDYGYTIWVEDKHGTVKRKQRTGYDTEIAAIQAAYIAMQKPDASMPYVNTAVIFKMGGKSKSYKLQTLREIVETQSPEFSFGRARNPVPEGKLSKLKKATALYEAFRDKPGAHILEKEQPDFSTGVVVGRLTAIEYDTVRGDQRENYRHKFKKHAAPLLCVTSDGKTAFTVDGDFTFTERGFVDRGE